MKKFTENLARALPPHFKSDISPLTLLHFLCPPSTSRQMFGFPQAVIIVTFHSPLYGQFEIFHENMSALFFKSFQSLIVSKQRNTGESMYDTLYEYIVTI